MGLRIGFIGAGQMARALAGGFLKASLVRPVELVASDPVPQARTAFAEATGGTVHERNDAVIAASDVLFLATKPQSFGLLLPELRPHLRTDQTIVSIAAGITLAKMAAGLGLDRKLIRVMPNTPCLVGASASGLAYGGSATEADAKSIADLLNSVGYVAVLPEALLDAVTGLSGSGPAYAYLILEAMSDGGVRAGLPRDVATRLAAQTLLGSAKMVLETGQHPGALKDMVTSPGGTTIAGLAVLERAAVRAALSDAIHAATARSKELGAG